MVDITDQDTQGLKTKGTPRQVDTQTQPDTQTQNTEPPPALAIRELFTVFNAKCKNVFLKPCEYLATFIHTIKPGPPWSPSPLSIPCYPCWFLVDDQRSWREGGVAWSVPATLLKPWWMDGKVEDL